MLLIKVDGHILGLVIRLFGVLGHFIKIILFEAVLPYITITKSLGFCGHLVS